METGQTVTVTRQIHCPPCCSTRNHPVPFPVWHTRTHKPPHTHACIHTTCTLSPCCTLFFWGDRGWGFYLLFIEPVKQNNSLIADFSTWCMLILTVKVPLTCSKRSRVNYTNYTKANQLVSPWASLRGSAWQCLTYSPIFCHWALKGLEKKVVIYYQNSL